MRWSVIDEFPEYQVSDSGLILCNRVPMDGRKSHRFGRITNGSTKKGYRAAILRKPGQGKPYSRTIHRLMAIAFLPNPNNYTDVAHNDGNPSNNAISNLRWCSHRDNQMDMRKHGTMQDGEKCVSAKITEGQARTIRERAQTRGEGCKIAKEFGLSVAQVSRIKTGKRWVILK